MKILLAVDFSPASEVAATEVAARSWPVGTTLEVLSVFDSVPMYESVGIQDLQGGVLDNAPLFDPGVMQDLEKQSQEMVERVATRLGAKATSLDGDPKSVIVAHAKETGADFVVVGSHGATDLERFLLGSVAKAVVHNAPCSVAVVRGTVAKGAPRKILLATDGGEGSQVAARSIAARPWPEGTEVRIFSAVHIEMNALQSALEPIFVSSETIEAQREEGMKHAQTAIAAAEQILTDAGLETSESISVLVESPRETIVAEAKSWGADLIVVGAHGESGIAEFLLGSVSEAVATHAPCSVEVIRKSV